MDDFDNAIRSTEEWLLHYCETVSWDILPPETQKRVSELRLRAAQENILSAKSFHPDLDQFREQYHDQIVAAIKQPDTNVAKYAFLFAMMTAFANTFLAAYTDGGGTLPADHESLTWLGKREAQERTYIEALIVTLILLRQKPGFDIDAWAEARADGYLKTLDSVYNIGKLRATTITKPYVELTLDGPDGDESCETCQTMKNKWEPASWWLANDMFPYPGNENYICKGYKCQHEAVDRKGNPFTVGARA